MNMKVPPFITNHYSAESIGIIGFGSVRKKNSIGSKKILASMLKVIIFALLKQKVSSLAQLVRALDC